MLHPRWTLGVWIMSLLLLCGGDDACRGALTLEPPEVVGELEEDVLVNCTSSEESPDAVFWTYGGTESDREEEKNFYTLALPLSKWNMTARCTVKLNATFECSRDLKISVYKIPTLKLLFPYPMTEGNSYQLQCNVRDVAPAQKLRVRWSSGNQTLHTQTFGDPSVAPVTVISTLNITADRTLHGDEFQCEAELDLGPLGPEYWPPMPSLTMTLDVQYAPMFHRCPGQLAAVEDKHSMDALPCYANGNPAPTVRWYFGGNLVNASQPLTRGRTGTYTAVAENGLGRSEMSVQVTVEYAPELRDDTEELLVDEGANVSLACGAEGNPLSFNWTCDGQNMNASASALNVTRLTTNSSCTCTAHNHLGAATKVIHLHAATPRWSTAPLAAASPERAADAGCPLTFTPAETFVRLGDPVAINCSSSAAAPGITWEVPTGEVGVVDDTLATWSVRQMTEWNGTARCVLNLGDGNCAKVPSVTLYKPPDLVLVKIPDQMVEGVAYPLTCDVISVAPVQNLEVQWYYGIEPLQTQTFNVSAAPAAPANVSTTINVTADRGHHGELFRCEAVLDFGPSGPQPLPRVAALSPAVVQYKPVFRGCPEIFSGLENTFRMDMLPCDVDGNPAATVRWYHEGREINASEPLDRARSGMYMAKAENSLGTSQPIWMDIRVEYEPSFVCGLSNEVTEGEALQSVCEPDGLPRPIVTWIRDGKELERSHRWKKDDSGNYLVRATNAHGTAHHELYLDVLYAPLFSAGNSTVEVTPGNNAVLECFADGNPSPEIQWIFHPAANVVNTTGWRRSVLTVSKATSTNAGVYTCVATNKVGRATRSDTLQMKDQTTSTFLPAVFWALLVLLVAVMILGLIVCSVTCKNRRKHRRYSFVPSTSRNDSERSYPLNGVPEWKHA